MKRTSIKGKYSSGEGLLCSTKHILANTNMGARKITNEVIVGAGKFSKRLIANQSERNRVRKLNAAFVSLKQHIPYCDVDRIRTKLDILHFAMEYIRLLQIMASGLPCCGHDHQITAAEVALSSRYGIV